MFGCNHAQAHRAAGVLRALANEWRELSAGAEGFLTGGRRGLEGQQVVWGEMDSFVGGTCLPVVTLEERAWSQKTAWKERRKNT